MPGAAAPGGDAAQAIAALFDAFDRERTEHLELSEVTALFHALSPELGGASAANAALEALLVADANLDQKLSRKEFEALLSKVSELAGVPLLETARKLLLASTHAPAPPGEAAAAAAAPAPPSEAAAAAAAAQAAEAAGAGPPAANGEAPPSASRKLGALFALWSGGAASVSFAQLCQGLAKLSSLPTATKQDMAALLREAASVLAAHDADGDGALSSAEFAAFLRAYTAAAGFAQLEGVLDELLLAASRRDSRSLQRSLEGAAPEEAGAGAAPAP
ncbi:hypothetical protein HT031_000974 [Scenedesmus sp. PABB004]|nr:hypothetical protein HT031_000974 [Scenedesmus sp. PABB004]